MGVKAVQRWFEERLGVGWHYQNVASDDYWEVFRAELADDILQAVGIDPAASFGYIPAPTALTRAIRAGLRQRGGPLGRDTLAPWWRDGRVTLWIRRARGNRAAIQAHWAFGARVPHPGAYIRFDDEGAVGVAVKVWRAWLSCYAEGLFKSPPSDGDRELGFFWADGALFVKLWSADGMHIDQAPFANPYSGKRKPVLHVVDWLLGKPKRREERLDRQRVTLNLPEGPYVLDCALFCSEFKRPRWPVPARVYYVKYEPERPIPVPDSGDHDWSTGDDDAISSGSRRARSIREAVGLLLTDIQRERRRHGGPNWTPQSHHRSDVV